MTKIADRREGPVAAAHPEVLRPMVSLAPCMPEQDPIGTLPPPTSGPDLETCFLSDGPVRATDDLVTSRDPLRV
ncbi:hypothetical protein [Blastococcus capsensis]|uniref:hypothetical protein n=1 Tax=Blastococcus capsensis TaxID=1564163 RepID=UPI0025413F58|nr:hypothetical protein [Blastococcus capsensis]MDK3258917.1 hypothetical protein [Blastococcus capsensis]